MLNQLLIFDLNFHVIPFFQGYEEEKKVILTIMYKLPIKEGPGSILSVGSLCTTSPSRLHQIALWHHLQNYFLMSKCLLQSCGCFLNSFSDLPWSYWQSRRRPPSYQK